MNPYYTYGILNSKAIPVYIVLAIIALLFSLLLKYAYKHNTKFAELMNKFFSWCILIIITLAPIVIISVIIFIIFVSLKH